MMVDRRTTLPRSAAVLLLSDERSRLVRIVSVALADPDEATYGADLFAQLPFLEHTQFSKSSIIAVRVVNLVAIESEHRIGRVLQVA